MGGDVRGKTVAVLGLTFKPNTDDMRDSPAIAVIQTLQDAGATVRAYDPGGHGAGEAGARQGVDYCEGAYDAMKGADALVIVTEWDAFRALDFKQRQVAAGDAGAGRPAQHLCARDGRGARASAIPAVGR